MGNFNQHVTASTATGIVYGVGGALCGVPETTCLVAAGGCAMSGMLPDIDSDSSRSFQECIYLAAGISTFLVITKLKGFPVNPELITLAGACVFLFVRFGIGKMINKVTVHRGMFHSIPAAMIAGQLGFLLMSGPIELRLFKAFGVFLGFMSHLILDEIFSIDLQGRRIKKSFGTALKMFDRKHSGTTLAVYATVAALFVVATKEPEISEAIHLYGHEMAAEAVSDVEAGEEKPWWSNLLDVENRIQLKDMEARRERRERRNRGDTANNTAPGKGGADGEGFRATIPGNSPALSMSVATSGTGTRNIPTTQSGYTSTGYTATTSSPVGTQAEVPSRMVRIGEAPPAIGLDEPEFAQANGAPGVYSRSDFSGSRLLPSTSSTGSSGLPLPGPTVSAISAAQSSGTPHSDDADLAMVPVTPMVPISTHTSIFEGANTTANVTSQAIPDPTTSSNTPLPLPVRSSTDLASPALPSTTPSRLPSSVPDRPASRRVPAAISLF